MKKPLAVTMGDPAGIGPEIMIKAHLRGALKHPWVAVGDIAAVEAGMRAVNRRAGVHIVRSLDVLVPDAVNLLVQDAIGFDGLIPGQVSEACGRAAHRYIEAATRLALKGEVSAVVTLPVSKEAVQLAHPGFTGHTEMIAGMCGSPDPVMMLSSDKLSVTHVSTHVSMAEAVRAVTRDRVLSVIRLTHSAMLSRTPSPRIAVAGLNAHAGESGLFGTEETDHIAPAVALARESGLSVSGPIPPDTVFLRASRGEFDAVVAMYHDQGHIPLKLLDFEGGVNISLGLPIVRTSVDHGTAFDIAMRNKAGDKSFVRAFELAADMAEASPPANI